MRIPSFTEIASVSRSRGILSEATNLWNGLVGWWPLNEGGGGTAFDASGWGNRGAWNGTGDHHTVGRLGRCGDFVNASSDYIETTYDMSQVGTQSWWVAWWQKVTTYVTYMGIFANGGFNTDGTICIYQYGEDAIRISGDNLNTIAITDDGKWHHYVAQVESGVGSRLYEDSELREAGSAWSSHNINTTYPLRLGARGTSLAERFFNGNLSNMMFGVGRTLLPSEIQQLYADPWAMGRRRPTFVSLFIPTIAITNNPFIINRSPLFYSKTFIK